MVQKNQILIVKYIAAKAGNPELRIQKVLQGDEAGAGKFNTSLVKFELLKFSLVLAPILHERGNFRRGF